MNTFILHRTAALGLVMSATPFLAADPAITSINPDKSRYAPGQTVTLHVDLKGDAVNRPSVFVDLYFRGQGDSVGLDQTQTVSLAPHETKSISFTWTPPTDDYRGYLVEAWMRDGAGAQFDQKSTAVDVSTEWTRFPRYGYLSKFGTSEQIANSVWRMKNHHINGIQFYDWLDRHHMPHSTSATWETIARHTVSEATLRSGIGTAKGYHMKAMAYNLINGAYDGYWSDGTGVQLAWGLYTNNDTVNGRTPFEQDKHQNLPNDWESTKLYLFNPASIDWQNHLADQMALAIDDFEFDGWHIDTLGDRGALWTWEGNPVQIDQTYEYFYTNVKNRINAPVLLNIVGDCGRVTVPSPKSNPLEFIYNELWDWNSDADDYYDLKQLTEGYWSQNGGKAVVYAAYMNMAHAQANPGGAWFNEHSVRLMDATVFASGASHLELGDDGRMLCDPYFPWTPLAMSASLADAMRRYYTFLTAYQNLLRGGATPADYGVYMHNVPSGYLGEAGKVWTFGRDADGKGVVHFINLTQATSTKWRDNHAQAADPGVISNTLTKIHYTGAWRSGAKLWWASPDVGENKAYRILDYTLGSDGQGNYVQFTLPTVNYWTMVWFER